MEISREVIKEGFCGFKASSEKLVKDLFNKSEEKLKSNHHWNGFYLAPEEKTACGYLPSTVETTDGNGTGYIHKVSFQKDVNVLITYDESFKTGKIDMNDLIESVRQLGIPLGDGGFMDELGKQNYIFKCYVNLDNDFEIIIPESMQSSIVHLEKYKSCTLKQYKVQQCEMLD
ncbi:hypothetical protein [Acinetobacter sp. Ac_5812]|uniref:hypothetical protein n=1 Tax=Acinetobacter sp. Ac_5812 TaxID=1848937 RepID=UPI00148FB7D2|nr:hypothetical protein [Acinetobacter sp. Ac_5812]NNP69495.1 hypothetical protein [Acinetobacter sp. Ac_5812]